MLSGSAARRRAILSSDCGMNGCPEYPGLMLMQSTRSASPATAATSSGFVCGLNATPTCNPCARACAIVAGTRDLVEMPRRVVDHQVAVHCATVERVYERGDRLEHDRTHRDRLDEV